LDGHLKLLAAAVKAERSEFIVSLDGGGQQLYPTMERAKGRDNVLPI
jgi:hypothetical protein